MFTEIINQAKSRVMVSETSIERKSCSLMDIKDNSNRGKSSEQEVLVWCKAEGHG